MMIYEICGLYGWDEHAALAQTFLEADYLDNHFAVAIGIALNPSPKPSNRKPMELYMTLKLLKTHRPLIQFGRAGEKSNTCSSAAKSKHIYLYDE